jgi:hypothetical protein
MHVNGVRVKMSLMFYIEHNIHYFGMEIDVEALEELVGINRIISPHEMKQIIIEDKEKSTLIEHQEDKESLDSDSDESEYDSEDDNDHTNS